MKIQTIHELFHFVQVVGRSNADYCRFCLKLEVSVGSSFCRSDDITLVSDHQTSLSIKWYNFPHHGLG